MMDGWDTVAYDDSHIQIDKSYFDHVS
jgi:hypothetical protein